MAGLLARRDTPNDYITGLLSKAIRGMGIQDNERDAWQQAKKFTGILDWTPVGIPQAGYDAGGLLGGGVRGRSLAQTGAGLGMAALAALPMRIPAKKITAYHGSPYKFDKFDINKIGTGEGAQVYGHGLYFAENEKTAKAYRKALKDKVYLTADGQLPSGAAWQQLVAATPGVHPDHARAVATNLLDGIDHAGSIEKFLSNYKMPEIYNGAIAKARDLGLTKNPGHMYQVEIGADPAQFLDWDAPLTKQPPEITRAYKDFIASDAGRAADESLNGWISSGRGQYSDPTGKDFYGAIYESMPGIGTQQRAKITETLHDAGIPGIKYLDQGSRQSGEGSRNYVVFNPSIVDILKRYAMPAAAIPTAAGAVYGYQPQQKEY